MNNIKHGADGTTTNVSTMWGSLDNHTDYLIYAANAPTAGAGDCVFKKVNVAEYKTENTWIELHPPNISEAGFKGGIEAVAYMQQQFENKWHWSKIFQTIGKIAHSVSPVVARLGGYGAAISPFIDSAGGIANILSEATA